MTLNEKSQVAQGKVAVSEITSQSIPMQDIKSVFINTARTNFISEVTQRHYLEQQNCRSGLQGKGVQVMRSHQNLYLCNKSSIYSLIWPDNIIWNVDRWKTFIEEIIESITKPRKSQGNPIRVSMIYNLWWGFWIMDMKNGFPCSFQGAVIIFLLRLSFI